MTILCWDLAVLMQKPGSSELPAPVAAAGDGCAGNFAG
jgi:hypothetical protein